MKTKYTITGMTCGSCEAKVKTALFKINEIDGIDLSKDENLGVIESSKPVSINRLKEALEVLGGKYSISESVTDQQYEQIDEPRSWLATYKPLLLIGFYILLTSVLIQYPFNNLDAMLVMQHFMGGFFLVFSFFKFLDLKGFHSSYQMYDVIAKRLSIWAWIYPFIELSLGIGFIIDFDMIILNSITLVIMSLGTIGVIQSVMSKNQIQCACLGTVFNLPMTSVTIYENGLMILMSTSMMAFV